MILHKLVEYYVLFMCAKSWHCSSKSITVFFVHVCLCVFVHVDCATDPHLCTELAPEEMFVWRRNQQVLAWPLVKEESLAEYTRH